MTRSPDEELFQAIPSMDKPTLLSDGTMEAIFDQQNTVIHTKLLIALRDRAREIGCLANVDLLIKAYQKMEKEMTTKRREDSIQFRAFSEGERLFSEASKKPERDDKQLESLVRMLTECRAKETYSCTDKGNGELFADIFQDKHRYNPDWKDFAYYDSKRWVKDIEGMKARTSAKILTDALLQYASRLECDEKEKVDYIKHILQLTRLNNRNAMLNDAKDKYCFHNEDLDKNDCLLNCQNGVLTLKNEKIDFLEHSPGLLLSKICNVTYDPAAVCQYWENFISEVMCSDGDKIRYIQKLSGLCLTGITKEETMWLYYGPSTRNGKSTLVETLCYLLGDYAATIRPETLSVKQNNDSRQANGDIARLKGVRFVNASEPPKRMIFDIALVKSLLGRDTITARHLHEREFEFIPSFKLIINTNHLPQILDDTVFTSGRVNIVTFDRHFSLQEQDKELKNKLRTERELSGILNWCIEGLRMYYAEGLKPPEAVKKATEDYRQQSDKVGNFINEMMIKSDGNAKAKDVYNAYVGWCNDNGYGCENKSNFFSELKSKGLFAISGTIDGKTCKNIVKGYTLEPEFMEYQGKGKLPFD